MKYVGAHVSTAGGVFNAPAKADEIKAKSFALFTKNQKQWSAPPLSEESIQKFHEEREKYGYAVEYILPHDGYLINLGNPGKGKRAISLKSFLDELKRCEQLGLLYLNTHPGSSLKKISEGKCLDLVAEGINRSLEKTSGVTVVIENTAGQGGSVGYRFEHLAYIIDKVEDKSRIGVCYDTCHGFAAGYDIRKLDTYAETMRQLDQVIGFKYVKGVHLNDAKSDFGSRVDRHLAIGQGNIGLEGFKHIMNDPRFDDMPLVLETPDSDIWAKEIKLLYSLMGKPKGKLKRKRK